MIIELIMASSERRHGGTITKGVARLTARSVRHLRVKSDHFIQTDVPLPLSLQLMYDFETSTSGG